MSEFWNPYAPLDSRRRRLLGVGAALAVLLLWSVVAASGLVSSTKLPAPWEVLAALSYLSWHDGGSMLLTATLWSVGRLLVAGVLVICIGIPIGIVMGAAPQVNAALSPLVDPFRSAPVVALLPILVMWLGIGETMKIAFLFIGAVVYLIPMVRDAIQAVPQSYWIGARDPRRDAVGMYPPGGHPDGHAAHRRCRHRCLLGDVDLHHRRRIRQCA
jgi:ABC-type nitrate/sulfonate/bicarbonate transport system permease component